MYQDTQVNSFFPLLVICTPLFANVISALAETTRRVHVGVRVSWKSGGSIIVRRLICLLYTAGGLLSGIPFYGYPTAYVEFASSEGAPLRTRHMLLHHVAHCRRGATPGDPLKRGTVSAGERDERTETWGALIAHHLTLRGRDFLFNRVWSPPPSRWLASRHVNVLFLRPVIRCVFCGAAGSQTGLPLRRVCRVNL